MQGGHGQERRVTKTGQGSTRRSCPRPGCPWLCPFPCRCHHGWAVAIPERGSGTAAVPHGWSHKDVPLPGVLSPDFSNFGLKRLPTTMKARAMAGRPALCGDGGSCACGWVAFSPGSTSWFPGGKSKKFCRAPAIERAEWSGDPCQALGCTRKPEDGKRGATKAWGGKVKARETSRNNISFLCQISRVG